MSTVPSLALSAFLLGAASAAAHAQPASPELSLDGDPQAGHVTASWSAPAAADGAELEFELQEASTASFEAATTRYRGRHTASVLSGMPDGSYFFRVRQRAAGTTGDAGWSAWSAPESFTVEHHSLRLALSLFALGGVVFVAILVFLTRGARRTGEPSHG